MEKQAKEKKKMSKKKKIILISILVVLLAVAVYCLYFFVILSKWEPKTDLTETNTDPVLYKDITEMKEKMGSNYPDDLTMLQAMYDLTDEELDDILLPVPGMKATKTITSKGKYEMCTSMTPQGIVACEDGVFISAYCHTHQHNSVVYHLDLEGNLLNTITLPSKSHVGALSYDTINKILWVSEKKDGKASLGGLNISTIKAYSDKNGKQIKYDQFVKLQGIKNASYFTYYNGAIYVGLFSTKSKGRIMQFNIGEGGVLDGKSDYTMKTDDNLQGLFISDTYAYISKSYGPFNSKILTFPIYKDNVDISDIKIGEESALFIYEDVPKLEQIGVYSDVEYYLYESSAFCYRQRGSKNIDRVIVSPSLSLEEWSEKLSKNEEFTKISDSHVTINMDVLNYVLEHLDEFNQ